MNQTFKIKFFNHLLVLLGFAATTSCDNKNMNMECMYGTPTMDFEVSGKVVNKDSAPIAGIKVSCYVYSDSGIATTLTAADGSFKISGTAISPTLNFEDIDGLENGGQFADKTQDITVSQIEEGDGSWYMGKYEAKGVVIEMEEKK